MPVFTAIDKKYIGFNFQPLKALQIKIDTDLDYMITNLFSFLVILSKLWAKTADESLNIVTG